MRRYQETVRASAPWLPNNVDFIQRINGLASRDEVRRIVYDASYLVMGLGDVYLGAPCAVPIDPRHRLLTSKYNPARTYTAEGTVGIGGVYMCIYGMDSPGGYQLVGRSLPIWNTFMRNPVFQDGKPWLLRFFDQVRFIPSARPSWTSCAKTSATAGPASASRRKCSTSPRISVSWPSRRPASPPSRRARKAPSTRKSRCGGARMWRRRRPGRKPPRKRRPSCARASGWSAPTCAAMCGRCRSRSQSVSAGDTLVVVEAMKMELSVIAPAAGVVTAIRCVPGKPVNAGDPLVVLAEDAPCTVA